MRIGIEASRLIENGRTGTENYLYNLVKEWSINDGGNEFVLYFKEEPSQNFWNDLTNGNKNFSFYTIKDLLSWTQISLMLTVSADKPDILFCPWHTMPGFHPRKTKVVSVFHDATGRYIPSFWTARMSDQIVAVSMHTHNRIIAKYGLLPDNIKIIYEGYNESLAQASWEEITQVKQKYSINKEYILFLGSVGPRKNLENMIKAYNSLNMDIEFVIAGKIMEGSEDLQNLPAKFIGPVPDKDLAALYSGAKLLAFVSKEEGFGLPILEAYSCGIPVLTSNNSATKEIAGRGAYFVSPEDVEGIKEGMRRLIVEPELRHTLIDLGHRRLNDFSWEQSAGELLNLFNKVIAE